MTPNIDALVGRGVMFDHAHIMGGTVPAVCQPSRAMLVTGRNLFNLEDHGASVPESHQTFPEVFRKAGYQTHGIGKWHNGKDAHLRSFENGACIFFGGMTNHFKVPFQDFDATGEYPSEKAYVRKGHSSELISDAAVDFLRNRDESRPFLLYTAFLAPHDPRVMPESFRNMYSPDQLTLPANFLPEHPFDNGELRIRDELLAPFPRTREAILRHMADYYAMISHLDAQIGRILDALEESGLDQNTIVVFTSDNGLAVGRHGLMGKQNLYDHSVRVPLVLAGAGMPKRKHRHALCCLQDLYPTLCECAGIGVPDSVEGRSLVPALHDKHEVVRPDMFCAYGKVQRSVREEDWKLIEYLVNGRRTTQLFNLSRDPDERKNLAPERNQATRIEHLRELLLQRQRELNDPLAGKFTA